MLLPPGTTTVRPNSDARVRCRIAIRLEIEDLSCEVFYLEP
jgi:hypothetical protein